MSAVRPGGRVAAAATVLGLLLLVSDVEAGDGLPDWYRAELARLTAGSGRWVASNAEFRSEQEPYEAYAVEWRKAADGRGVTGRLVALVDGREVVEFWQYRTYWDANAQQAVATQFASFGAVGSGQLVGFGAATLTDQTLTAADGRQWREMHHAWFEDDVHVTQTYGYRDGGWTAKRRYRWQLQPD